MFKNIPITVLQGGSKWILIQNVRNVLQILLSVMYVKGAAGQVPGIPAKLAITLVSCVSDMVDSGRNE